VRLEGLGKVKKIHLIGMETMGKVEVITQALLTRILLKVVYSAHAL
jgi:hypothetical protein